jgi:diguanylate cyclase (GGDEF)-like protein
MRTIVRVAIIAVTIALFFASSFNALLGHRDISVLLALATPLGISAWGFARAGHNEAAMALLSCVMITVITLVLVLNPLGVHDLVITAYSGIVLVGALVLSRRSFLGITALTVFAAVTAFVLDMNGMTRSLVASHSGWPQLVEFLVVIALFATIGRVASEQLLGSIGDAHLASVGDAVTGLANRAAFLVQASARLAAAQSGGQSGVLVLADLDGFRRMNLVVGHRAADAVLREAAERLRPVAGPHLLARVGDDEFAILAVGALAEGAESELARAVHAALEFEYSGVTVRCAVGYARFPRDAHGIEPLVLAADSSLASAKAGRGGERIAGPADRI